MFTPTGLTIRPAGPEDLPALANLIHFETYVHRHLDYRPPLELLDQQPFLVLENQQRIVAALASPPDPPQVAWIRLFAVTFGMSPQSAWERLWPAVRDALLAREERPHIAVIPIPAWFEAIIQRSGFVRAHDIVTLEWQAQPLAPIPLNPRILVRPMVFDDLPMVQRIDATAFEPIWQNSLAYLEFAFHHAAYATLAELDGIPAGYSISTATSMGCHLARLATQPALQGQGVGKALLYDLMDQFYRRGARQITVNTQHNNLASLSLYEKFGFRRTGEIYPVYEWIGIQSS